MKIKLMMKISKKLIVLFLIACVFLTGCAPGAQVEKSSQEIDLTQKENKLDEDALNFSGLDDPKLCEYVEKTVYEDVIDKIDNEKYLVEDVKAIYVSKEYLDELSYNSQSNIYFGYKLSDIEQAFNNQKYIFTCDENGETVVKEYELYDDTFEQIVKNVAIGAGVILICVTVTAISGGVGAPAVAAIFAASAKTGTLFALGSAGIGAATSAIVTGIETGNVEETVKQAEISASEGFKYGAITGAIVGGLSELITLGEAAKGGLTLNEAAQLQKTTMLPANVIKSVSSPEEASIYETANLKAGVVNGKNALIRDIDLNYKSELGGQTVTNLERMKRGNAAVDPFTGQSYELHHVGQTVDSPLAILTKAEHMGGGNNGILHDTNIANGQGVHSLMTDSEWASQRSDFWKGMYELLK